MKVLCDVHLPYRLVNWLRQRGVDATHVNGILDGSVTKDAAVAAFADANRMILITKDTDFRDSHFLTGAPSRLIRVTPGQLVERRLTETVRKALGRADRDTCRKPRLCRIGE